MPQMITFYIQDEMTQLLQFHTEEMGKTTRDHTLKAHTDTENKL